MMCNIKAHRDDFVIKSVILGVPERSGSVTSGA